LPTTRVLVASADEGTRAQVRLTLGDERFTVEEASDTDGAIRAVAEALPDLTVLDLALPGAGALAFARTLRAQPETSRVRILLFVPRGQQVPDEDAGIDATLAVPVTSFALLRKIDELAADDTQDAGGADDAAGDDAAGDDAAGDDAG
jgi:CheY-like chemotaxis protein